MYKLNLQELPPEGREYFFTDQSGELNEELSDLVGDHAFEIRFFIKPVGSIFELTGSMQTQVDELCSRCGWDLNIPLKQRFHEFLMIQGEQPRNSQSVHGNQSLDFNSEGPNFTAIKGEHFLVGEFFHEMIALLEPTYPSCGVADCEHLKEANEKISELEQNEAEREKPAGHPAFSVLKDLLKK